MAAGDHAGEMLSTTEAARRLGVPLRRVYELVKSGALPGYRGERSTIQVQLADLESLRTE